MTKDVIDLYTENCKTLLREILKDLINGGIILMHRLKSSLLPKLIYRFKTV